jgi:hypothetical protein
MKLKVAILDYYLTGNLDLKSLKKEITEKIEKAPKED